MEINQVSGAIISAAMRVHTAPGPGLSESAYEACLSYELRKHGFDVKAQVPLPVLYEGVKIDVGYRIDLLAQNAVIVEPKTVERLLPVRQAQLLSYLKLGDKRAGLLINFHVQHLRDGIKRLVD